MKRRDDLKSAVDLLADFFEREEQQESLDFERFCQENAEVADELRRLMADIEGFNNAHKDARALRAKEGTRSGEIRR